MVQVTIDHDALKFTAIASVLILTKCFLTAMKQGGARFAAGFRPPEDEKLNPKAGVQSFDGSKKLEAKKAKDDSKDDGSKLMKARAVEARWTRIVANDLENIPVGLAIMYGSLLSASNAKVHAGFALGFAVSRILHTIAYANELQPHRALAFFGGVISVFGMAINGLVGAL